LLKVCRHLTFVAVVVVVIVVVVVVIGAVVVTVAVTRHERSKLTGTCLTV